MNLRHRVQRLERLQPVPPSLTAEERLQRLNALLGYRGNDPGMLARQERAWALLREFRAWRARGRGEQRSERGEER
jgi:hypothetical protein